MSSDIDAIRVEDYLLPSFDARSDSLGREWVTNKKAAKFVGAEQRATNAWFGISSFAILGTPICPRVIPSLVASGSF